MAALPAAAFAQDAAGALAAADTFPCDATRASVSFFPGQTARALRRLRPPAPRDSSTPDRRLVHVSGAPTALDLMTRTRSPPRGRRHPRPPPGPRRGSGRSEESELPARTDRLVLLRAGGADAPSGVFVRRASDGAMLGSANSASSSANSDPFFADTCTGLGPYVGQRVHLDCNDLVSGGRGETLVDDFRPVDAAGNVLTTSQRAGGPREPAHSCPCAGGKSLMCIASMQHRNEIPSVQRPRTSWQSFITPP